MLYHTVWTFHVHCRVRRRDQAPVCQTLCGRCISRENISAECCHNISFQTDLWLPLRWGMTLRGLLYFFFPAPVMSYLFRSPLSCFVWWRPLFTVRVAMRHGAFLCFFTHRDALYLPPWAEKSNLGQWQWTQRTESSAGATKPDWNLLAVHSRLN